jgi:hypothetical protein
MSATPAWTMIIGLACAAVGLIGVIGFIIWLFSSGSRKNGE